MLKESRQKKLTPILEELRKIKGVVNVRQDDFDSNAVNVFLTLSAPGGYIKKLSPFSKPRPNGFEVSIRSVKAAIRRFFRGRGIIFGHLDQPTPVYQRQWDAWSKKTLTYKEGYDGDEIKIEVYV
jgi:hypothetical protein